MADTWWTDRGMVIEVLGSVKGLRVEQWPSHADEGALHGMLFNLNVCWSAGVPSVGVDGLLQMGKKGKNLPCGERSIDPSTASGTQLLRAVNKKYGNTLPLWR